jgi:hypothetical protein
MCQNQFSRHIHLSVKDTLISVNPPNRPIWSFPAYVSLIKSNYDWTSLIIVNVAPSDNWFSNFVMADSAVSSLCRRASTEVSMDSWSLLKCAVSLRRFSFKLVSNDSMYVHTVAYFALYSSFKDVIRWFDDALLICANSIWFPHFCALVANLYLLLRKEGFCHWRRFWRLITFAWLASRSNWSDTIWNATQCRNIIGEFNLATRQTRSRRRGNPHRRSHGRQALNVLNRDGVSMLFNAFQDRHLKHNFSCHSNLPRWGSSTLRPTRIALIGRKFWYFPRHNYFVLWLLCFSVCTADRQGICHSRSL